PANDRLPRPDQRDVRVRGQPVDGEHAAQADADVQHRREHRGLHRGRRARQPRARLDRRHADARWLDRRSAARPVRRGPAPAVGRGALAYNWGIRFAYRTQKDDYDQRAFVIGTDPDPTKLVQRGYKAYVPDVWLKAGYKQFQLELEGVAQLGSIKNLADYDVP